MCSVTDKKRVLVIDDEALRRWLGEYLADLGYEAHSAVDGEHGIRSAIALRPALILLDLYVPDPSLAIRFADAYRARVPAEQRAPIVVISGTDRLDELAQRIGADATLSKPFELGEVTKLLVKFLEPAETPAPQPEPESAAPAAELAPQPETGSA